MNQRSKVILVTGAGGFIGRALCRRLVEDGYQVRGVVRHSPQKPVQDVEYVSMSPPPLSGHCTEQFDKLCEGAHAVIHLAGAAHGKGGQTIEALHEANVRLTEVLALSAIRSRAERFIFVSSIGVNGSETRGTPVTASSKPSPSEAYAESKLNAERRLCEIASGADMSTVIIRPPLVYGADAPGNFHRLLRLADSFAPLPFANANNKRSVISLGNLVDLLVVSIEHPGAANRTFLAADGAPVSTREMIEALREGLNRQNRMFPLPLGMVGWCANIVGKGKVFAQLYGDLEISAQDTREALGWTPDENTLPQLKAVASEFRKGLLQRENEVL